MAAADLPPDVLARILSLLPSTRDTCQAMAVCRAFMAAGRRVESLRFWFSRVASDMNAGAQNVCDSSWLGSSADTFLTSIICRTQTLTSLEIICTDENFPPRHPSACWTGFPSSTVLPWLRHLQPTLQVLHFDNFRLTPEAEMVVERAECDGSGSNSVDDAEVSRRKFTSLANLLSKARGASSNVLRRSGGSCDLSVSMSFPRLQKAGGSADLSLLRDTGVMTGTAPFSSSTASSASSSRGGSPLRGAYNYLRRAGSSGDFFAFNSSSSASNTSGEGNNSNSSNSSNSGNRISNLTSSLAAIKIFARGRSSSEPNTPRANSPQSGDGERGGSIGRLNDTGDKVTRRCSSLPKKYQLSLTEMLRELEGGQVQRVYVSRVSVQSFGVSFFLPSLTVLHIAMPPTAPGSGALNSILAGCCNLSQLYLSTMDAPEITASSYSLSSESLKVLCLSKVSMGALKLTMPKLEVFDFDHVKPLMAVLIETGSCLEVLRMRECGSTEHREELHIVGATKLQEIEIDATSIGYFNSALSMVRTAGDVLRSLRLNVVPPVLPTNVFEMAMEIPDLRSMSIGKELWEALLRGKGEVKWSHFEWGRLQEIQIDFGIPQFAALYLLHDLVLRCRELQRLVIRCLSKESYAWIQAPMHEYLSTNCPQVDLQVELLRGKECFSLEAMAA